MTLEKDVDIVEFTDIGIQRVKKELVEWSLNERRVQGIDPFNQGYNHSTYDKMSVKLCFQVFKQIRKHIPYLVLLRSV